MSMHNNNNSKERKPNTHNGNLDCSLPMGAHDCHYINLKFACQTTAVSGGEVSLSMRWGQQLLSIVLNLF